jgi:signal transduction histidine kinase
MFRSVRTRLTALYVFVAIALVVTVGGAVTAFALSTSIFNAIEAQSYVVRQAPDLVRTYAQRHRPLPDAAGDIVRRLSRPGLRIMVVATSSGMRHTLAFDDPMSTNGAGPGAVIVPGVPDRPPGFPEHREPPPPFMNQSGGPAPGPPPEWMHGVMPPHGSLGFGPPMGFEHDQNLPFNLGSLYHVRPRHVAVPGGMVVVFVDPRPLNATISAFWTAMLPIGLFSILAAWLLGRYITDQALRPLTETTEALRRFASGDFTPRAIVSAERNEIGELVTAYNGAVQQVTRAFEERRTAESQMRQFVADAGHELRTPLTVIMGFIDVLRKRSGGGAEATTGRIFDTMTAESRRMRTLIDKLIVLARLDAPEARTEELSLADLAAHVVSSLSALDPGGRLLLRNDGDAVVRADPAEMREAVSNIVENALRYAPGSIVEVTVSAAEQQAVLSVRDHGAGMSAEECAHVFDRFYRGSQRGETEGFGLGLAIAKRAVERAGGTIAVESAPGEGSRFTIALPRTAPRSRAIRTA